MNNLIICLIIACTLAAFAGCGRKDEPESKNNLQYIADKEKELNDREARIRLKEIELEEREKKLNLLDTSYQNFDTTQVVEGKDSTAGTDKKHIQQELSKKFENPTFTVRDYFEYLKRGIDETGSFDANMKKAQKYYPSRSVDKLKNSYRRTKSFNVLEEPRIVSQKDENAVVVAKVKQTEVIKKDGKDQEVTRVLTVTYSLTANKEGQWVIKSSTVKIE